MTETNTVSQAPKRSRWLRWVISIGVGLVALVVIAYLVGTSGTFFKGVVLPRIGKSLNADITVADAQISPFSMVLLRDLKVQPKGAEPLFTANEVRARYSLMAILRGTIAVDEVTVVSPTVNVVQNADGTSNLDPILKASKQEAQPPASPGKSPVIDIKNVTLSNGTVRQVKTEKDGGRQTVELSGINVKVANLKNGQIAKAELSADLKFERLLPAPGTNGAFQAKLAGNFDLDFTQALQPRTVKGSAKLVAGQASGAFSDLATFTANLDCDVTPAEVKQLAIKFLKGSTDLGQLRVSGPFDLSKLEGKLNVEVVNIDRQVLNLAGSARGIDFGASVFNSTNQVTVSAAGKVLSVAGRLTGASLSVAQKGLQTPVLDLAVAYNVAIDQPKETATLQSLTIDAARNQRPLLKGSLAKPMTLEWAKGAGAVDESAFNLALSDFNLADWRAFLGTNVQSGLVNANLDVVSRKAGQQLTFTGTADGSDLSAAFGASKIAQAGFHLQLQGGLADFRQLQLTNLDLKLSQRASQIASAAGSGLVDLKTMDATLAVKLDAALPGLATLAGTPGFEATSGTFKFDGNVKQENATPAGAKTPVLNQSAQGNLILADFTGRYGDYRLDRFETSLAGDVGIKSGQATVRKLTGTLKQAGQPAGGFDLTADYNLTTQAGALALKLADVNQNALRPFLAAALGNKKLASVSINANLKAGYDPKSDSVIKGDLQVTNLVVNDPTGAIPATPLEAKAKLDVVLRKKVADIREGSLTLTPTARARNELLVKGQVDFARTNMTGALKITAESLDATRYFDLFAGGTKPGAAQSPAPSTVGSSGGDKEPEPIHVPVRNFVVDASIGHFFLREVEIANFLTTVKLNDGAVLLKPFQFSLNGAPVNATADLDLGVPGFKYDVDFKAKDVPLAPLVNSFQPERKGQIGGTATATAQIKGAGITGAGLQKNLAGQFDLTTTNLNLAIVNIRAPVLKTLINTIVAIPDLIRNPGAVVGNLLSRLTGGGSQSGGWADELTKSPIDVITARGTAGGGRVEVQRAFAQSPAFQAEASGASVTLAPIMTNSAIQVPIMVSLRRPLADKVGLVPAGTPTNAVYVKLPDFVKLKGTVGEPKTDINYLALTAVAGKAGAGIVGNTGAAITGQAAGVLGAVENLLGGGRTNPATPAGTNRPPATNAPASPNLLDLFKK